MKNKGFTLIELIAVVVMLGMILLVVFPATSRLLRSNENKKYDTYYDAVKEAIELYARTRRDELGGIDGEGCVDDKKLSELKKFDYINEFTEEKNVTCLSPGDFTTDRLAALGIDTSKQYVNVRIKNTNGRISVQYSMICVRNYNDPTITSLLYSNLVIKSGACENDVPVSLNSLYNEISEKYTTDTYETTKYLKNNPNNNYVLYSGNLWRIISFDTDTKTIKLVTDDSVAIASYNNMISENNEKINNYSLSNIYYWLQDKFLPILRNPEKYLYDAEWNYSAMSESTPENGGNTLISKVGLINAYEYHESQNFLFKNKTFWLITPASLSNVETTSTALKVNTNGSLLATEVSGFSGVRPSIVLRPNVSFVNGGEGTISNPYRLTGDLEASVGAKLNNRYVGEYVSLDNTLYRISDVDANYTKLIAVNTIPIDGTKASTISSIQSSNYNTTAGTISFHSSIDVYSDNTFVGKYLKLWDDTIEAFLTNGDFCKMTVTNTTSQTIECPSNSVITTKLAIPRIGELYAINSNKEYWTISNAASTKINVISTDCTVRNIGNSSLASILPVLVIKNDAIITGGSGTSSSPYTIE